MTAFSPIVALVRHGNDTEALITEVILPLAIDRLYSQLTMPQLVSVDTADEAKNHGDTIRIAKPIEFADADDHPTDSAGSQSEDITAGKVDVKLDRHLYKQFAMKDVEFLAHANSLSLPSAAEAAFVKGDVLTIAGSHQTFVVTADTAGSVIPVYPSVVDDIAASTAVTVVGDHPVDLAFTKSAFLIAFRNLEVPEDAAGVNFAQMSDPRTGISLRMLRWYEPRTESTQWKFETLCGLKTVSPERALRLGGH